MQPKATIARFVLDRLEGAEMGTSAGEIADVFSAASAGDLSAVAEGVADRLEEDEASAAVLGTVAQHLAVRIRVLRGAGGDQCGVDDSKLTGALLRCYERTVERMPHAAGHFLQALFEQGSRESIAAATRLLLEQPPEDWRVVGIGLGPLWRADATILHEVFAPLVRHALQPSVMAVLLDLANHAVRSHRLTEHPWRGHAEALIRLLNGLTSQLERMQTDPAQFGTTVEDVQQQLYDALALVVGLCDALGLTGDRRAVGALEGAMELAHRRIQTEAAAALARLDVAEGKQRLIALAADPVARRRAVSYAEELGIEEEIEPEYREPRALAESELAAWLAAPDQFGFPPTEMELVDARTQYWPGFEEPQPCWLFRFTYMLSSGETFSNIGLAGPVAMAFHSDLANLPIDDIYAAMAGWHAEHAEIFEVPANGLNAEQRSELERLVAAAEHQGYESIEPIALAFFFQTVTLVARARQGGRNLCIVVDDTAVLAFPTGSGPGAMTPEVATCIYRGRRLLRAFNP